MKKLVALSVLAFFCISMLLSCIPIVKAQSNLLINPDYENSLIGWTVTPGTGTYTIDSIHHSGSSSVKGVETTPSNIGRLYQNVTSVVIPGSQYKISGWMKTENVTGSVVIGLDYVNSQFYTAANGYISEIGHASGTQDWTYYESPVFTVPPMPAGSVALYFLFDFNNGAGTAWFDDMNLSLVSGSTASPFIRYTACHDGSDWITVENHQLTLRHRNYNPVGSTGDCSVYPDYCGFIEVDGLFHPVTYVNSQYLIDNKSSLPVSIEAVNRFTVLEGRGVVTWEGNHTILINDDGVGGGGFYSLQLYSQNTSQTTSNPSDGWPMFGHDLSNARYSKSKAPHTSQLLWSTTLDKEVRSAVTVQGDKAYVGTFGGSVYALNASTGEQIWKFSADDRIWATPTIANGIIYIGSVSVNGTVYALNATTGAQIWKFSTGESMWSSAAVVGNIVYFGSNDNNVYAVDAHTGRKIWNYTTGGDIRDSPAVVDGVVYISSQDGYLYAINATTGEKVWSTYTVDTDTYTNASPAYVNGTVYIGSGDSNLYAFRASDGSERWRFTTGAKVSSSPAVFNGIVYAGSENHIFYAVDSSTGIQLWNYTLNGPVYSSPAVADGLVFIGSYGDTVYAFNATTGVLVWSYQTGNGVFSSPTIAGGVMFVGSYDYKVYAFGASYTPEVVSLVTPSQPTSPDNSNTTLPTTAWAPAPENGVVATVVATGAVSIAAIGVAAATSASTSTTGGIISKIVDKFREFLPKTVKSWIEGFVASKHKLQVDGKKGSPFKPTKSEIFTYIISVIILTISFAYVEVNSLNQFLLVLPTFFATSIIVGLVKTYILTVVARTRGVWTEYKIWYVGVVMYIVSSLAFRFPFSSPTRSVHHSRNHTKHLEVILSLAGIFITLGFAGFFFILLKGGLALIGGTGLAMCLIAAFFEMFPLEPMGGKTIFKYNKALWAVFFLMTLGLYAAWLTKIF